MGKGLTHEREEGGRRLAEGVNYGFWYHNISSHQGIA